jgi:hypothetical protein
MPKSFGRNLDVLVWNQPMTKIVVLVAGFDGSDDHAANQRSSDVSKVDTKSNEETIYMR